MCWNAEELLGIEKEEMDLHVWYPFGAERIWIRKYNLERIDGAKIWPREGLYWRPLLIVLGLRFSRYTTWQACWYVPPPFTSIMQLHWVDLVSCSLPLKADSSMFDISRCLYPVQNNPIFTIIYEYPTYLFKISCLLTKHFTFSLCCNGLLCFYCRCS